MKTVIHWFRSDLCVSVNVALSEAVKCAEAVIIPRKIVRLEEHRIQQLLPSARTPSASAETILHNCVGMVQ